MATAWIQQKSEDKAKFGDTKAPWYVCWRQAGKQRKRKIGSKSLALKFKSKIEAELMSGELEPTRVSWDRLRKEYETHISPRVRPGTMTQAKVALDHFERISGKIPPAEITAKELDSYVSKRLKETSKAGKSIAAPTVNKELRQLRAVLRQGVKWNYLRAAPPVSFVKELTKLPTYIDPETFAKIYEHADAAIKPIEDGYSPGDWWRAYLVWLFMSGWRCMEPLSIRREDLDLNRGTVLLRAEYNKGGRDELVILHAMVVDHAREVKTESPMVFPWEYGRRTLWTQFHRIQEAAEVSKPDGTFFGFHDLRRAFASMNADRMSADALQALMRHRDYGTTKRYVNLARQMNPAIANLYVPDLPQRKGGAQ